VNTTIDPDHVGGNEALAKAGHALAGGNTRPAIAAGTGSAPIFAHENLLGRLTEAGAPAASLPTDSYFVKQKDLFVNGEAVQLLYVRAAHTDGDTVVFFRRSDVISAGDVFTPDRYPTIDLTRGGSIEGLLAGLNYILELAVPDFNAEGGTMIVPGHGRLCDESDVGDYRDMVTIVRDRVFDMVQKKMTLEQVKAARPSRDYDEVYARAGNTGDTFVEAVYKSLTAQAGQKSR
jgi:glyoxylase-like metal-dependent hydrolase (beta-lactamase superfamily II)